jgi:hypothetical protein
MDKIYAVILDNEIINVIVWDGETPYTPMVGTTLVECPEGVGIGWTYNGTNYDPPKIVTPSSEDQPTTTGTQTI